MSQERPGNGVAHHCNAAQHFSLRPIQLAVACALAAGAASVWAGPTGEQVVAGQASVSRAGANTLITQTSDRTAINWQNFNIGTTDSVRFAQPSASSIALNRVLGQNPTEILGSLTANGQIFILNPNGVLFGKGAQVDVGGLVASTLSLSNNDFMAGNYRFVKEGSAGEVLNQANITANGGYVAMIGPQVKNEGKITATGGAAALTAGEQVTLNLNGNKLIGLTVDKGALNALVDNKGVISAGGGQVILTAKAADQLIKLVVNNTGIIEAGTLSNVNGVIRLEGEVITNSGTIRADGGANQSGGKIILAAANDINLASTSVITANGLSGGDITVRAQGGTLLAEGRIEARGIRPLQSGDPFASPLLYPEGGSEGNGGTIKLLGEQVGLIKGIMVDASGHTGGGMVLVGGDYQGKNADIQNAFRTYVSPDTTIKADAITNGDGGKVIVWSNDVTRYYGSISAKGGSQSGNGGFVETSGKVFLDVDGGSVDTRSQNGNMGTWLLDPTNIQVITAGANATAVQVDQFTDADQGGAGNSRVSPATLDAAGANVILQAQNDITLTDAINLVTTANANLTLQAGRSIVVNNSVATNGAGNITMVANNTSNTETNAAGGALTGSGGTNRGAGAATLTVNGALSTGAGGKIKLVNSASAVGGGVTGDLNITAAGTITTANRNTTGTTGAVTLTAGAAIALNANVTTGDATVADAAGNQTPATGSITLSAGTSVSGNASGRLITGAASVTGAAAAGTDTATSGSISVTAGTGAVSGGIGLAAAANALTIGSASRSGGGAGTDGATSGNIFLSSRDEINNGTLSGALGVTHGAASGSLTNVGGTIRATTTTAAGNVFLDVTGPVKFGITSVAGNLSTSSTGPVSQSGLVTVTGTSAFNANANGITMTAANNFTGAVSFSNSGANAVFITDANALVLGSGSTGGNLTISAAGAVTQTAPLTVAGTTSLTSGIANNLTLDNAGNQFTGAVRIVTAKDVTLSNNAAFSFGNGGTSAVSGSLSLTAAGPVTQANTLTVAGTTSINAGANPITLTTGTNNFTGAVSLNNSGANNVSVTDTNAIVLGTSNVGTGTFTVNATGANSITQTGAITQAASAGAASFTTGGGVITLTQANDFTGAVSATNTGANAIQLTDTNALQLGTVSTANTLTVNAGGSITQSGVVSANTLVSTLTGAASELNLGTQSNNVTNIGAITAPAGFTLTNGNNPTTVTAAINTTNAPVAISTGTGGYTQNNVDIIAGSGAITVAADAVAIVSNTGSNAFQTTGVLTLKPSSAATTMSLALAAPSTFDLTAAEVTNLAGGVTGAGSIVIGDAAASTGAMTIGAAVSFGAKTVTLNAGSFTDGNNAGRTITATDLILNARTGAIGAAPANGAIDVAATNLTVNTVNQNAFINSTGAVNFGTGTSGVGNGSLAVTITGAGNAITQSATGAITADTLTLTTNNANATLNTTTNAITSLGTTALGTGKLNLLDAGGLTVTGAVGATGGITLNTSGALAVNNTLNASGNTVSLTTTGSGNAITQNASGAITATTLALTTTDASATLNGATNALTNLGATALGTGTLNLLDAGGLTVIGAVGATGGITLNTSGALAVNNTVNAGTGNVTLSSTGAVTQSAAITAAGLELLGVGGAYTLTDTGNNITTLAANTGTVSYTDSNALSIGTVNATAGISATGLISVATNSGDLTVSQTISTTDTTASAIILNAGKATAAGTAAGGNIIISGSPTIGTGAGGRATLFSGSILGSTGLTALIGSGSGRFRYNSDEAATNYSTALGSGNHAIYREQPALTITADNPTAITYGGAVPAYTTTVTGVNGDTALQALSTQATVADDGIISGALLLTAAAHTLTPSGALGQLQLGYAAPSYVTGTLTVNKKDTNVSGSRVYNGSATALGSDLTTIGALIGGDTVTVIGSGARADKDVSGSSAITTMGSLALSGGDDGNYNLLAIGNTLAISKAGLLLSGTQVYNGGTAYAGANLTATGVAGETFGITGAGAAGNLASKDVQTGSTLATLTGLALGASGNGGLAGNYNAITTVGSSVDVTPEPLMVTAQTDSRGYNGTTSSAVTPVVSGTQYDAVGTAATQAYDNKNVGTTHTLSASGLVMSDGNSSNNYAISYVNSAATGVITAAPLTVSAATETKLYDGGTTSTVTPTTGVLFGGDTVSSLSQSYSSKNVLGVNGSTLNVNAGYVVTDGNGGSNYTVTLNAAAGTITARDITVPANNATKIYGSTDPVFTFNVGGAGLVGGDTVATVFTGALARVAGENVVGSPYSINRGTLASNTNYSITTYTPGQFTITPRALSIVAEDKGKLTGDPLPPFSATYSGFAFVDNPASLAGVLGFATPATATSPAGTYIITPSGQSSTNYTISYGVGTLTVGAGASLIPTDVLASINSGSDQLPPPNASGPPAVPSSFSGVQPNNVTEGGAPGGSQQAGSTGAVSNLVSIVNGGVNLPAGLTQ